MVCIIRSAACYTAAIECLLDRSFGSDRYSKASYRFRDCVGPVESLARVALDGVRLIGSIQYWPARLNGKFTLLLGPIAIESARRAEGLGTALMLTSLAAARAEGWRHVFLVGDEAYYRRFGFQPAAVIGVSIPIEDSARLLYRNLSQAAEPPPAGVLQALPAGATSVSTVADTDVLDSQA